MRKKVDIDMESFGRDAAAGMSIPKLADKYGIGVSTTLPEKAAPEPEEPEVEEEPAAIDEWELKITMPTAKLDSLLESIEDEEIRWAIGQLENQDKANIVQIVLQNRLDDTVKATTEGAA